MTWNSFAARLLRALLAAVALVPARDAAAQDPRGNPRAPTAPAAATTQPAPTLVEPVPLEIALRDGTLLPARRIDDAGSGTWRVQLAPNGQRDLPVRTVLAVHGAPVAASRLPAFHLVGGDVVRGVLVGGDARGETFELQSPVLGRLRVPVDRLACAVFQPDAAQARDLALPDGVDEALFVRAEIGFDRLGGTLHQLGDPGVRFQIDGAAAPKWYPTRDLVGLRLRGGVPPAAALPAELVTRSGDRVGVAVRGCRDGRLQCELENGGALAIPFADVGSLTLRGDGVTFVSSLQPVEVREASFDGDVLWPWRADANATGGPLVANGRTHGKGLGVHAKSRLVFAVPDGATHFLARVGFDDAALRLPVRGIVDARVLLGDRVLFAAKDLRAGEPPRSTGLLNVRPGQHLTLEVDFGEGRDLGDQVDWLTPVFLAAAGR